MQQKLQKSILPIWGRLDLDVAHVLHLDVVEDELVLALAHVDILTPLGALANLAPIYVKVHLRTCIINLNIKHVLFSLNNIHKLLHSLDEAIGICNINSEVSIKY